MQMRRPISFFAAYRALSIWTFMEGSKRDEDEKLLEVAPGWARRMRIAESWTRSEDYSMFRAVPILVEINRLNERRFRFLS